MTEEEWFTSTHVSQMMRTCSAKISARKLRLFMAGWQRLHWEEITIPIVREAIELAESFADGVATKKQIERMYDELRTGPHGVGTGVLLMIWPTSAQMREAAHQFAREVPSSAPAEWVDLAVFEQYRTKISRMSTLLRDIVGNPFRLVTFSSTWRTDTARALARQMYGSRDFGAMPILADALQDAGCDNEDILNHCRDTSAPHVRGCWVADLVLGKS